MKDFPLEAKVVCVDGESGKSTHVIIERNSQKVTHFVARVANLLESHEYLVPIEQIIATTPKAIQLRCTKRELAAMPSFTQMQFLNPVTYKYEALEDFTEEGFTSRNSYLMWSNPVMDGDMSTDIFSIPLRAELIPDGEMAIYQGASVEATDGHIGRVEEFLLDPNDNHITHVVLEEGHLWHKKELTLPMSAIDHMDEDYIFLKLDKETVKSLPAIPVKQLHKSR